MILLMVHSLTLFSKILKHFLLRIRLFCMALVEPVTSSTTLTLVTERLNLTAYKNCSVFSNDPS